ncbi:MAG TPA: response regulator transcription factor [Mycobacteriales bacterium]|nr:response regulator transcription factor [Mycobacteriales bacterium]
MTIRVLIADDQPLMRSAIRTCLAAEADLTVVAEAVDGRDAVRQAERLRPGVVVMDIRMPVMDGIEATRRITGLGGDPPVRVLVMTTFDLDENIIDALRAGASGFLVKDAPPEELIRAVRLIGAGQALLSPSVTRRLLDLRGRTLPPLQSAAGEAALGSITARERTVLKLVARGLSNSEIAQVMDLALSSVKTHIGHLLTKLAMTDRVQLVVFAYEHELVRPGAWEEPPGVHDGQCGA